MLRWLLDIGNGVAPSDEFGNITLPPEICLPKSADLITEIFGKNIDPTNVDNLAKSSILCPTNEETLIINEKVLERLPGLTCFEYVCVWNEKQHV